MKKRTVWSLVAAAVIGLSLVAFAPVSGRLFEISKNLEIFNNLYKEINTYYVDDVDPGKLMKTGVDAMLATLDPYTNYISESQIERFRFMTEGRYNGIGAVIFQIDGAFTIVEPHEGSPSFEAGLRAGDILLEVDGQSLAGRSMEELGSFLRGAPNSSVQLKLRRPGSAEPINAQITRSEIEVPNVPYFGLVEGDYGYINLTTFSANAGKNVSNALRDLKKQAPNLKGVILDLRENGGGLLREAVNLSNVFIPKGEEVVVTKGKVKDWDQAFKTLNSPDDEEIPLTVLINKRSASASEIVSGVIQDLDRGVLIGQRSYGKGLVQNTKEVGYNSRVKLTTAKYYIPSGRCIQSVSYKDGEPLDIPDSLRTPFKTRSGRRVLDGGGVAPDVLLPEQQPAAFVQFLLRDFHIFSFVTEWMQQHPVPAGEPEQYRFTDYDAFLRYIQKKKPVYQSESDKALQALRKELEKEEYLKPVESEVRSLEKKITRNLDTELDKNKAAIIREIEQEIVTRQHYQKGKIRYSLKNDPDVQEAVKVMADASRYNKILRPGK